MQDLNCTSNVIKNSSDARAQLLSHTAAMEDESEERRAQRRRPRGWNIGGPCACHSTTCTRRTFAYSTDFRESFLHAMFTLKPAPRVSMPRQHSTKPLSTLVTNGALPTTDVHRTCTDTQTHTRACARCQLVVLCCWREQCHAHDRMTGKHVHCPVSRLR